MLATASCVALFALWPSFSPLDRQPQISTTLGAKSLRHACTPSKLVRMLKMSTDTGLRTIIHEGVEFCARGVDSGSSSTSVGTESYDEETITSGVWTGREPRTEGGRALRSKCTGTNPNLSIGELPLFPISTVLLPGSELPFQIFPEKTDMQAMFKSLGDRGHLGVVLADYDRLNGSFARVGCLAEVADMTELDDGRLIVETVGVRRFKVLRIAQWRPHIVAVVQYLEDAAAADAAGGAEEAEAARVERECWRALQEVVWLCADVYEKRTWLPLLMSLDGKRHPLAGIKRVAPADSDADILNDCPDRRGRFSWDMMRIIRNGIPGLWDHDLTDSKQSSTEVQRLMEERSARARLSKALDVVGRARQQLQAHRRLKDLLAHRDIAA